MPQRVATALLRVVQANNHLQYNQLSLALVTSKPTADRIVDRLEDWWQQLNAQVPQIHRWVINADSGPENP